MENNINDKFIPFEQGIISVAIATYNGEKYILELLQSILDQTRQVDEIIIYDDNSYDDTLCIIDSFFKDKYSPKIKIMEGKNVGHKKNFERAIGETSGKVIFLADQDDVWKKDKVLKIMKIFEKYPEVPAIFSDGYIVDENLNSDGSLISNAMNYPLNSNQNKSQVIECNWLTERQTIVGATLAFRSHILNDRLPFPEKIFHHDSWLGKISIFIGTVMYFHEPLIDYRQHSDNVIGITNSLTKKIKSINKISTNNIDELARLNSEIEHLLDNFFPENSRQVKILKSFKRWQEFTQTRKNILQNKNRLYLITFVIKNFNKYFIHSNGARSIFLDFYSVFIR